MDNYNQVVFNLTERSYLNIIKKDIAKIAVLAGLSSKKIAEIELIVSEISTNLLKHAGGGEIIVRALYEGHKGIEILSIDKGPGMSDPAKMIEDGVSTTNTLGHGLGSIKRLSDQFQLYSVKGWGTVLLSRVFTQPNAEASPSKTDIYPIVLCKPGETLCGDSYAWKVNPYFVKVLLADGLGHGPLANKASQKACEVFKKSVFNNPSDILNDIHRQVKDTRGLVGTVAVYDLLKKEWKICGVGNISTRLCNAISSKTHMPYNGILGVNISSRLESQSFVNEAGSYLILCSDGISSRWETSKHPSVFRYDLSILSAVIYKDYARQSDDMSVVVLKVS